MKYIFFLLMAFMFNTKLNAMEIRKIDNILIMEGGTIGADDLVKYRNLIDEKIDKVLLRNQLGGDLQVALMIARGIEKRNLHTVVSGYCLSACNILFLSGNKRSILADAEISSVYFGIHGSYDTFTGVVTTSGWGLIYNYIKERTGEKFKEDIIKTALTSTSRTRAAFLYIYSEQFRKNGLLCSGRLESECKEIVGANMHSMGFLNAEPEKLILPDEFNKKDEFVRLHEYRLPKIGDHGALMEECKIYSGECESILKNKYKYDSLLKNKSLSVHGSGKIGVSWGAATQRNSIRRSLYECVRKAEDLCDLAFINDYLTTRYSKLIEAEDSLIIKELDSKNIVDDGWIDNNGIKMQSLRSESYVALTPSEIPGVQEISTKDLVDHIKANDALIVDVACQSESIPTSICIFGLGHVSGDSSFDSEVESLMGSIFKKIIKDKTLIIYGLNSLDWRSANASFRSQKMGYRVKWYRAGIEKWKSHGLPVRPVNPKGAVLKNGG